MTVERSGDVYTNDGMDIPTDFRAYRWQNSLYHNVSNTISGWTLFAQRANEFDDFFIFSF